MYEPLVADGAKLNDVTTESAKDTVLSSGHPGDVIAQIHLPRDASGQDEPVVVLRYAKNVSGKYDNYMTSRSRVLGRIQVAIGILAMILNIIGICIFIELRDSPHGFMMAAGIWGGIFFCLSGSFALHSAKSPKRCPVVAHMVVSIMATVAAAFLSVQSLSTIGDSVAYHIHIVRRGGHVNLGYPPPSTAANAVNIAISVLLLVCGLVELVTCIWSSTLTCRVTCCGGYPDQITVEPVTVPYSESKQTTCTVKAPQDDNIQTSG